MEQFFILGNPRSGTSLLRLILNSHKDIVVPPESGFLLWWYKKYSKWTTESSQNQGLVDQYIFDLKSSKKMETWNVDYNTLCNSINKNQPDSYLSLSQQVSLAYANQQGKSPYLIGDKNNYYIHHLQELHQLAPHAKYLHIIRDGRDVACSYKALEKLNTDSPYKPTLPTKIGIIANEWVENNQKILAFSKMIAPSNYFSIRYEDLILSTEKQTKSLCDFFRIEYDKNMMLYYEHNKSNKEEPIETLDWKRKTLQKPDKSNINKYLEILSQNEVNEFNKIGRDVLIEFGYE